MTNAIRETTVACQLIWPPLALLLLLLLPPARCVQCRAAVSTCSLRASSHAEITSLLCCRAGADLKPVRKARCSLARSLACLHTRATIEVA